MAQQNEYEVEVQVLGVFADTPDEAASIVNDAMKDSGLAYELLDECVTLVDSEAMLQERRRK